jgi:hypothetical protein
MGCDLPHGEEHMREVTDLHTWMVSVITCMH